MNFRRILFTTIVLAASRSIAVAQELVIVKDTVNHFEVGVPVGWRYGVPVDKSVAFIAFRLKQDHPQDLPKENFNVNIIHHQGDDFDGTYAFFVQTIGKAKQFKIVEQGEKEINGRKYKYLIESHINPINNEMLTNYDLFTNYGGEVVILTMVTTVERFQGFRAVFEAVALSLKF